MSERAEVPRLRLIQFAFSHYNEKVRWALDYKGLEATREDVLPGPHARLVTRLSGQSATPLLMVGDEAVAGSARILERLDGLSPDPPLLPADPASRARSPTAAADGTPLWRDDLASHQVVGNIEQSPDEGLVAGDTLCLYLLAGGIGL